MKLTFKEALEHRITNESQFGADAFGYTLADGPAPPYMAVKTHDGSGLNVRSAPTNAQANKVGAISDGSIIRVEGQPIAGPGSAAWVPLTVVYVTGSGSVGMKGFGAGEYLQTSNPPPANAPKAPPPAPVLPKPGPPLAVTPPPSPLKPPSAVIPGAPVKPGDPLPPPASVISKVPKGISKLWLGVGAAGIGLLAYTGLKKR